MARAALRLRENAPGEFFVDETCIDCATCRNVAPSIFAYSDGAGMTAVKRGFVWRACSVGELMSPAVRCCGRIALAALKCRFEQIPLPGIT